MKTTQELEEMIIDLYLKNEIGSAMKEALILMLNANICKGHEFIEEMLKSKHTLKCINQSSQRETYLEAKGLKISDMPIKRIQSIFTSLVEKGFLKQSENNYSLTDSRINLRGISDEEANDYLGHLDIDDLSDEEALVYLDFKHMLFGEMISKLGQKDE